MRSANEDWNPNLYLKFEDERTRPPRDLLARIPLSHPRRVVDIGCGPGNSTELLAERWPDADLIGMDSSPNMIAKAQARLPAARFEQGDIASWQAPEGTEVLFANAVFQWLPDHPAILERLLTGLSEGGALAVQMPDNVQEPSHRLMNEAAAAGPWAAKIGHIKREELPSVGDYYNRLKPLCRHLDIWHTHYYHPLDGAPAIVEWFKSTGLRTFLDPLSAEEREGFLADYGARIAQAYPARVDGKVLLRFPRLFIVAVR
ncbi:trans-aconitate 2-methyltransferase [Ancylobacter sp. G4_0304]|uniref:trans-aconitate 2-methyltransferase n=1 Tax=Ancylobacter sp. G4_0304 TaxID=3114289 RepID=UPI0039C61C9C